MHTLLNARYMDAIEELRKRKSFSFACEVLLEGRRFDALLGPRAAGSASDVQVSVDGHKRVVRLGQVSIAPELAARLALVSAELDTRARTNSDVINARLWSEHQAQHGQAPARSQMQNAGRR